MFKLLLLIATTTIMLALNGCGGGGGGTTSSSTSSTTTYGLPVTASDGVIAGAKVHFSSLKGDQILVECTYTECVTDTNGKATLKIPASVIANLADDDIPFLYVESTTDTSVGGVSIATDPSRVKLKSYLPKASVMKSIVATSLLADSVEITQAATVSHFSNAIAVMVEGQLGLTNPVSSSGITNKSTAERNELVATAEQTRKELINRLKTNPNGPEAQKFKGLAVATKAIIDHNIKKILSGGKDRAGGANIDEILLEMAKTSNMALDSTYNTAFTSIFAAVNTDLGNSIHAGSLPKGFNTTNFKNIAEAATKQATGTAISVNPVTKNPKLLLYMPYQGQSASISLAYQKGIEAGLGSTSAISIVTMDSSLSDEALRLSFYGVNNAGQTNSNNIHHNLDYVGVASFYSGQTRIFGSHPDKKMLVLSSGTSSIFEQGYDSVINFAASNKVQMQAMFQKMMDDARKDKALIPYIIFVENDPSLNQYSLDLYSAMLSNQSLVDIALGSDGSLASTGSTSKVTYPQLLGTFNLFTENNTLKVPVNSIKELVKGKTKVRACYFGLRDNFVTTLKAMQDNSVTIDKWYTADGIYTNDITTALTNAGVTGTPNVSVMSLGATTSGTMYNTFVSAFNTKHSGNPTAADSLFNQIGYDMGTYIKKIADNINSNASKYMSRKGVLDEAKTTAISGVTGSKGATVLSTQVGWYDEYTLGSQGWNLVGRARTEDQ
jgi:hypothetical protein